MRCNSRVVSRARNVAREASVCLFHKVAVKCGTMDSPQSEGTMQGTRRKFIALRVKVTFTINMFWRFIMDFTSFAQSRKSVRGFPKKAVSKETIDEIINAAKWAPTSYNTQTWLSRKLRYLNEYARMNDKFQTIKKGQRGRVALPFSQNRCLNIVVSLNKKVPLSGFYSRFSGALKSSAFSQSTTFEFVGSWWPKYKSDTFLLQ